MLGKGMVATLYFLPFPTCCSFFQVMKGDHLMNCCITALLELTQSHPLSLTGSSLLLVPPAQMASPTCTQIAYSLCIIGICTSCSVIQVLVLSVKAKNKTKQNATINELQNSSRKIKLLETGVKINGSSRLLEE